MRATSALKKLPKVNNHPLGENSANLVTLALIIGDGPILVLKRLTQDTNPDAMERVESIRSLKF
jgi:hypothetical protein